LTVLHTTHYTDNVTSNVILLSLLPPLSPSSAVVLNHISPHFLIPLSDSSLICTVPTQWLESFWTL